MSSPWLYSSLSIPWWLFWIFGLSTETLESACRYSQNYLLTFKLGLLNLWIKLGTTEISTALCLLGMNTYLSMYFAFFDIFHQFLKFSSCIFHIFFCPLYTYPQFGPSLPHIDHQKGFLMSPSIVLRTKLLWAVSVNKGYYSHQAITLRPPGWWALRELRMETNGQPTAKPIQQSPPSPPPHSTPKEI